MLKQPLPDSVWAIIRYVIATVSSGLTTHGVLTDNELQAGVSAVVTLLTIAWGVYVKMGTRAVPEITAQRTDVPTVSPVTGKTIPGPQYTG
jgi:hypothetical protein